MPQSLGAETSTLAASDIAAELLRFARFENVTQIVLGRSRGGFITRAVAALAAARARPPRRRHRRARDHQAQDGTRALPPAASAFAPELEIAPFVWSTVAVAVAVAVGHVLTH